MTKTTVRIKDNKMAKPRTQPIEKEGIKINNTKKVKKVSWIQIKIQEKSENAKPQRNSIGKSSMKCS